MGRSVAALILTLIYFEHSSRVQGEIIGIHTSNVTQCGNWTCYHNAICSNDGLTCRCRHGYDGDSCKQDVNECEVGSPCYHRGHCNNTFGSWECTCLEGWTNGFDKHCENKTNPDIRYRKCTPGWMGDMCQDRCLNDSMCGQNEQCKKRGRGLQCLCTRGWGGGNCTTDVNECMSNPCKDRHVCLNTDGSFRCECQHGWTGQNCSVDVDVCSSTSPCDNNSSCINNNGSYQCMCVDGWVGKDCDEDLDECQNKPCNTSAVCNNLPGTFSCDAKSIEDEVNLNKTSSTVIVVASVGSALFLLGMGSAFVVLYKKCKRKSKRINPRQDVAQDVRALQARETRACPGTKLGFVYEKDKPVVKSPNLDF